MEPRQGGKLKGFSSYFSLVAIISFDRKIEESDFRIRENDEAVISYLHFS